MRGAITGTDGTTGWAASRDDIVGADWAATGTTGDWETVEVSLVVLDAWRGRLLRVILGSIRACSTCADFEALRVGG
jgi:hypothetical protein